MQPNILIFIVDQLAAHLLGCHGHPARATPHIDSIAAGGWQARACHVATPLCMPNRASLLTGRMPSAHGVRHNGIPLSLGARTFVGQLHAAGYDTTLVGKSHLQVITDKPALAGPASAWLADDAEALFPGNYLQESPRSWQAQACFEPELPFYGFQHVELALGHGDLQGGHYGRWLRAQGPEAFASAGRAQALPTPEFALAACGQAWRTRLPPQLHPTHWVADRTIAHLRRAAAGGRPFLAYCSFPDPHSPYTPPGPWWDRFRPQDMPLPASWASGAAAPPPHLAWLHAQRDAGRAVKDTMGCFAATPREAQEALALQLGSLAFIDAQVGRVLAALRELGREDDTIVVFTSDHGEFAGEHQLLLKGPLHYRSLIEVPLLWRDPAAPPGLASGALVSTLDIAPTLLARAGVQGYNGLQGRSLQPLVEGRDVPWRDALLLEEEGQRTSYGFDRPVRMRTLVTGRHRLSLYDGADWGELYDREADPLEHCNLWHALGHAALRDALVAHAAHEMLRAVERSPAPMALA